jgi:hypothetical protein
VAEVEDTPCCVCVVCRGIRVFDAGVLRGGSAADVAVTILLTLAKWFVRRGWGVTVTVTPHFVGGNKMVIEPKKRCDRNGHASFCFPEPIICIIV